MSYISEVMADNPLHLWLLGDPPGTVYGEDEAAVQRGLASVITPKFIGGPTLGAAGLLGTGTSVETGSSSYVAAPKPDEWTSAGTLEFWFKYVSGSSRIFSDDHPDGTGRWYFDISGTNPVVSIFGRLHTVSGVTSASLKTGRHHFVLVVSGTTFWLYLDGTLADTWSTQYGLALLGSGFVFGKDGANATFSPTRFAALAVYPGVLPPARVAAHYAAADKWLTGPTPVTVTVQPATARAPGTTGVTVTVMANPVQTPVVTLSTLVLASSTVLAIDEPLDSPTLTVAPLHIVSPAIPVPTLVDGRPQ